MDLAQIWGDNCNDATSEKVDVRSSSQFHVHSVTNPQVNKSQLNKELFKPFTPEQVIPSDYEHYEGRNLGADQRKLLKLKLPCAAALQRRGIG